MSLVPDAVEDFRVALADIRPRFDLKVEAPFRAGRGWWLDVDTLPILYREAQGFGLFAPEEEEPGLWLAGAAEAAAAVAGRLPALGTA